MAQREDSLGFDGFADGYTAAKNLDYDRDKELPAQLDQMFAGANEARTPWDREWDLHWQFLNGDQLIARNRETGEVVRVTVEDSKRLRSQFNILRPMSRSLVGKLSRVIPTCVTIPATSDFAEQNGTVVANAVLQWARRKEELDVKYLEMNEYLPWAGNSFVQLMWNPLGGRKLAFCPVCEADYPEEKIGSPCERCIAQREIEEETRMIKEQTQLLQARQGAAENAIAMGGDDIDAMGMAGLVKDEDMPALEIEQAGPLPLDSDIPDLEEIFEGDFECHVRDVREVYPEPGAKSIKECNWLFIRYAEHVATLRQRFPEMADQIEPERNIYSERTAMITGNSPLAIGTSEFIKDHVYVYEYYERPTTQYPEGRMIYMANGVILRVLDGAEDGNVNPYHVLGRFPLYHFGFDRVCGNFWFEAPSANAWHRQKELNDIETDVREHIKLGVKPKFMNPMGSRITQEEITATSEQIIKYNPAAGEIKPLEFPRMDPVVFNRRNDLLNDIRVQFAVTEQEMGAPTGDTAGRALAIIEAESDQQVRPILTRNLAEWREMHRGILLLCQHYAHPNKILTIAGPEGVQTYSFRELSLSPGWDLQIEEEDGLSRNPTVRLQQAMDLANTGVFNDPMTGMLDSKKLARAARLRIPGLGYEQEATESAEAQTVPEKLKNGQPHIPHEEDDPIVFARELLGWLRGPGRKEAAEDPETVMLIRQIWMFYAAWAVGGQPPPEMQIQMGMPILPPQPAAGMGLGMPPPGGAGGQLGGSKPGSDQSAPGGSTNNPGHVGSDTARDAGAKVAEADAKGESMARVQQTKEG